MASAALHIMLLCSNSGKEAGRAAADAQASAELVPPLLKLREEPAWAAVAVVAVAAVEGREEEGERAVTELKGQL